MDQDFWARDPANLVKARAVVAMVGGRFMRDT